MNARHITLGKCPMCQVQIISTQGNFLSNHREFTIVLNHTTKTKVAVCENCLEALTMSDVLDIFEGIKIWWRDNRFNGDHLAITDIRKETAMTKVGIVIPVRNCLDYTRAAVDSIKTKHPFEVFIVDDRSTDGTKDWLNSLKGGEDTHHIHSVSDPEASTGLAFNWNVGTRMAFEKGCTHVLVSNNDVLFHPQTIDNLVERYDKGGAIMVTGVNVQGLCPNPTDIFNLQLGEDTENEHPDFSCFMITKDTIDAAGWFDEHFRGAYCEDCDYHARIVLSGNKAITFNRAPYYHYASGTMRNNPQLAPEIQRSHQNNQAYFAQKWGRPHVNEPHDMIACYFHTPFNKPDLTIKDWQ